MASFDLAIPIVLEHEGGYSFDPADPGGETNFGISKKAYPSVDIRNLTVDQAKAIYRRDYWQYDGLLNQDVATKVFDLGVLCYPKTANKFLQSAVCACGHIIEVDGKLGPQTLAAANAIPPAELLPAIKEEALAYFYRIVMRNPRLERFLTGWLARAWS